MHNWETADERENGAEVFKIMAENFPKFMTDTKPQIHEAQSTSSSLNTY